jgi:Predicted Zn peptidase
MIASLPTIESLALWRRPENIRIIVAHLLDLIDRDPRLARSALAADPINHLHDSGVVTVTVSSTRLTADGGLHGAYDGATRTIRYNESNSSERDAFTVLHEFGHHLQRSTIEWAFPVLAKLDEFNRRLLEESVCDELASRILIDDDLLASAGTTIDSGYLARVYKRSGASRRATVVRVHGASDEKMLFAIVDANGVVSFSTSTADDLPMLPAGSVQPDFARLFAEAAPTASTATGTSRDGLRYSTGNSRADLNLSLTVDRSGLYAFVTATPTYEFGQQMWQAEERVCSSEACGEVFIWTAETDVCLKCGEPKCPECGRGCGCEAERVDTCQKCWSELSLADIQAGRFIHEDC